MLANIYNEVPKTPKSTSKKRYLRSANTSPCAPPCPAASTDEQERADPACGDMDPASTAAGGGGRHAFLFPHLRLGPVVAGSSRGEVVVTSNRPFMAGVAPKDNRERQGK